MTRQDVEPATLLQIGAVAGEFERLGYGYRPNRIRAAAILAGRPDLVSTRDLLMGEAGRLLFRLRELRDGVELAALLDAERRAHVEAEEVCQPQGCSLGTSLAASVALIFAFAERRKGNRGR